MVVVITGPIASGKSTVARELASELGRSGRIVAVIDLDLVYEMVGGTQPKSDAATWRIARRAAAALAVAFLGEGVSVVVADGSFNAPTDRDAFAQNLGADIKPLFVTLRVSMDEALRRAQGDPSRGISRDPDFLGRHFADVGLARVPPTDLVIDTEQMSATAAAAAIANLVRHGDCRNDAPRR